MNDKEKIFNMAACMLSILDSLKLFDNSSLFTENETLSEVMFRKMKAYDIDLNKELDFTHLEPVTKKDSNKIKLSDEMKKIISSFKSMGVHCYELYTLMSAFAIENKIPYDIGLHSEILIDIGLTEEQKDALEILNDQLCLPEYTTKVSIVIMNQLQALGLVELKDDKNLTVKHWFPVKSLDK
jgi:hypothetical protein